MNRSWTRIVRFTLVAVVACAALALSSASAFAKDASADIDQCANGPITALASCAGSQWQNGNLNGNQAHWFEGDSVPYRLKFADLAPNTSYVVTIQWDTTKSGKHAIDYITSYDRTETTGPADVANYHLNQNDACSDYLGAGCLGAPSTAAIPTDPQVVGAAGQHPASQIPGVMTMWGATLGAIAVSDYSYAGTYSGDSSTSLNVTFTTGAATNGLAVLAWGGHIATRADWGANNSAIAISGSPYHMRLLNLAPPNRGGNQDRSLTADAVIFPASVTVTKDVVPDSAQTFDFSATGATFPYPTSTSHSSTFTLGDGGSITSDKIVFFPGSGTIGETQPTPSSLWTTTVQCTYTPGILGNGGSATPSTTTTTLNSAFSLNEGDTATCNYVNTFAKATPPVSTTASAGGVISSGLQIHDTTQVGPGYRPTGTVQWRLYDNATCSGTPVVDENTLHATISNPSNLNTISVDSPNVAATSLTPGTTYHWVSRYLGDSNNNATSWPAQNDAACNDSNEDVTIDKASPPASTTASAGGVISSALQIHDTTQVGPGYQPTGTVQWRLYDNSTCSGNPVVDESTLHSTISNPSNLNTISVDSPNVAASSLTAGTTYHWVSRYLGDANNNATAWPAQNDAACNDPNEDVTITAAAPPVSTTASTGGVISSALQIHDTTQVGPGYRPTGTVQWRLYDNATCTGAPVIGEGTLHSTISNPNNANTISVDSPNVNASDIGPGTYHWVSRYLGDANNAATAWPAQNDAACNDANEDVTIDKASPPASTTASAGGVISSSLQIHDATQVGPGYRPTGTVEWRLYDNATCSGNPVVGESTLHSTISNPNNLNTISVDSPNVAASTLSPGTYHWVSRYLGDANNNATAWPAQNDAACADANEDVTITKDTPTVHTTVSSQTIGLGHSVTDNATLTGGYQPTGSVTFKVYGPTSAANPTCVDSGAGANLLATYSNVAQSQNGSWTSPAFTPQAAGHYVFVATYNGDANNNPNSGSCADTAEAFDVVTVSVNVVKDPDQNHAYDGDKVSFTISASNVGNDSLTNVALVDAIQGTSHTCESLSGPTGDTDGDKELDPGETWKWVCTVTVVHSEEDAQHRIVNLAHITGDTKTGGDHVVSNVDDASVPVYHPAIAIDKTGPATGQAGDKISYVLTVTNPGDEAFAESTVTVADQQCNGDPVTLIGKGGDASPSTLDPGDTWSYSCSVQTAVGDTAVHNVATVSGCDQFGKCVNDDGTADTELTQPEQLLLPERVTPGAARLLGPTGCAARAFNAKVRGSKIATVTFVLDGKIVKKVTNTKNASLIQFRINPRNLRVGVHRLVVNVTFQSGSGTKPKTIKLSFQRCAKKLIAPKFTG